MYRLPNLSYRAYLCFLSVLLITHCTGNQNIPTSYPDVSEENILYETVEKFFTAMKEKKYVVVWEGLTAKSKSEIVKSVISFAAKDKIYLKEEETEDDFAKGGPLAKAYWNGFLNAFNPDMVLVQSTWKINKIKKDYAEVDILYHKSEHPANLKLYKEEGKWKVGLEETFGYIRRYLMRK
ncbi:MAG: hypothetical protein N2317_05610 [Syntrophales bacterium]|nr:hypothetical protein [Syntrophales bacterium]